MSQTFEQSQQLQQTQVLTAFQIEVAKLMELPINELAVRVQDELTENAALEEADQDLDFSKNDLDDNPSDDESASAEDRTNTDADNMVDGFEDEASEQGSDASDNNSFEENESYGVEADAMGDYFSDDDVPDYLQQRAEEQRERNENFCYSGTSVSFYEDLQSQLAEHNLTDHESQVMEYLIGSLDTDGFLRKDLDSLVDELAIYHGIPSDNAELRRLLDILQHLDPKGLGASTLQECLLIQLNDIKPQTRYIHYAVEIVQRFFKEFAAHQWDFIKQRLGITDEDFSHVRHVLTHLNPLPGTALSDSASMSSPVLIPDVMVFVTDDGALDISLNNGDIPELRISPAFRDTLKQYGGDKPGLSRSQRDAFVYAKQKVDSARQFLQMLQRRQQIILQVTRQVVDVQRDFFLNEDDETCLKPLTVREVARHIGWSESVVSRVSNTKYLQTAHNIYPFKYFFSRSVSAQAEGDDLTSRRIRFALQDILSKENPASPYSDEQLASLLEQAGFQVARRTVAKYRDILSVPAARTRREMYRNGENPLSF